MLKQVNIGGNAYTAARGAQALGVCACVLHLTSMRGIYKQLRASEGVFQTPKRLKKEGENTEGQPGLLPRIIFVPPTHPNA